MSSGRNLKKINEKMMENNYGISGNTYFAKFGKIAFCMQPDILEMRLRSKSRVQSTILTADSD